MHASNPSASSLNWSAMTQFGSVVLLLFLAAAAPPFTTADDNPIIRWNAITQQIVRRLGIPNQIAARTFSLLHISQYKALQLAYQKHLQHPEAAASYAAHYVLSELYPSQQSATFDAAIAEDINPLHLTPAQDAIAQQTAFRFARFLLSTRTLDGSQKWYPFQPAPPGGPAGHYQFTPNQTFVVYPQLKDTIPFVSKPVKSYDTFGGPPAVPSPAYDADYLVLSAQGDASSPLHTQAQSDTALFWEDGAGTAQLASHLFNVSLATVGRRMEVKETAKLFANLAVAGYEAHIAAWYQKYKYLFWRPVTAFRQGDPTHLPRPTFRSTLNPPAEPEFPSGHATAAGAYVEIMAGFLGKDPGDAAPGGSFQVETEAPIGLPPRNYTTIEEPAQEIRISRVFGGIHFPTAANVGYEVGRAVGKYDWEHFERVFGKL